jgi:hypothetical protein
VHLTSQVLSEGIQVGDGFSDFPVDSENRRHGVYQVFEVVKRPWRKAPHGWEHMFIKYIAEAEFEHGVQISKVKKWIDGRKDQAVSLEANLIFDENKPGKFELQC